MSRNNIHMACGGPSGMRGDCDMVVEINMTQAAFKAKIPFYISENKVVLTPGVGEKGFLPAEYIRTIVQVHESKFIHQKPIEYICVYDLECNCSANKKDL